MEWHASLDDWTVRRLGLWTDGNSCEVRSPLNTGYVMSFSPRRFSAQGTWHWTRSQVTAKIAVPSMLHSGHVKPAQKGSENLETRRRPQQPRLSGGMHCRSTQKGEKKNNTWTAKQCVRPQPRRKTNTAKFRTRHRCHSIHSQMQKHPKQNAFRDKYMWTEKEAEVTDANCATYA